MNFRKIFIPFIIILMLIITSCGQSNSKNTGVENVDSAEENNDEVINLVASSGLPASHLLFESVLNEWVDKIEEQTNGKVKIEVFTGGELVSTSTELDALNSGMIDIALPLLPIYDPQRHPLTDVTMLPLLETNTKIATLAFNEMLEEGIPLENDETYYDIDFGQHDLELFGVSPTSAYVLTSASTEFEDTNDFKGALIRTSGRAQEYFVKNLGGSPTTISAADIFEAVSRGTVDGNVQSIADWTSYAFEDVHKYTIEGLYFGHHPTAIAMTSEKWGSLPEDIQEVFKKVTKELQPISAEIWDDRDEEVKKNNIETGGEFVELGNLDDDINGLIDKAIEETWNEWIEKREADGHPGKAAAIQWRDLVVKHGGKVPEEIMNME